MIASSSFNIFPGVLSSSVSHHSRTKFDILSTSAIVKIIHAGVVFTNDIKTLRIDLDPTSQLRTLQADNLDIRLVGLILILVFLCLISN